MGIRSGCPTGKTRMMTMTDESKLPACIWDGVMSGKTAAVVASIEYLAQFVEKEEPEDG